MLKGERKRRIASIKVNKAMNKEPEEKKTKQNTEAMWHYFLL